MKKFFVGLILALAVLACFGCKVEPERKTVTLFDLTSIYPPYKDGDYVRNWYDMRVNQQYTLSDDVFYSSGHVVPSDTPIRSGDSLVCKLTLTAIPDTGYTFDGVPENAFKHNFATVTNPVGSGTTMQVTIKYTVE